MVMYVAEVHPTEHTVIRVVVADSIEWCQTNIPGQVETPPDVFTPTYWLETADPYTTPGTLVYCGPGYGADRAVPERFALPWDNDAATIPAEDGSYAYSTLGEVVFHNGKIWRNLSPSGTPNVWEPPTNWREYPMGTAHPLWVQPVGAVDAYPIDFVVEHNGLVWKSTNAANVWEPGSVGAELLWVEVVPEVP